MADSTGTGRIMTPEQAEAAIIESVEQETGAKPGSLDLTQAVTILMQEYQEQQEKRTEGKE